MNLQDILIRKVPVGQIPEVLPKPEVSTFVEKPEKKNIVKRYLMDKRNFINEVCAKIWRVQRLINILNPIYEDLIDMFEKYSGENNGQPFVSKIDVANFFSGPYFFWIRIYNAKPEWMIENILGPIHRKWNVNWKFMEGRGEHHIEVNSYDLEISGFYFRFSIDSYETADCQIEQIKPYSPYQPDEYKINCAE